MIIGTILFLGGLIYSDITTQRFSYSILFHQEFREPSATLVINKVFITGGFYPY